MDECDDKDDQVTLIRTVSDLVSSDACPAIALFASRKEDQINTVFRSAALSKITRHLALDDSYLPDEDICLFLNESFHEIKCTHPFSRFLPDDWPVASDVQEIVEKSSGAIHLCLRCSKFCAMLGHYPEKQLKIVRGLQPRGALTPFAQLDALYQYIFSQVEEFEAVALVLAWRMFTNIRIRVSKLTPEFCAEFFDRDVTDIYVSLAPLQSVVDSQMEITYNFCTPHSQISSLTKIALKNII